jgi:hypothetical protein
VTRIDANERQRILQAREAIQAGHGAKARKLLAGIDHPKAQALLDGLEPAPTRTRFPLVALMIVVMLFAGGIIAGLLLLRPQPEAIVLPTLYPTSEPTQVCDMSLWQSQYNALMDSFLGTASAASRTLPGERLNQRLAELQATRDSFTAPCDADYLADYDAHLQTFDELLNILTQWANGELDGTQFSMAFEQAFAQVR